MANQENGNIKQMKLRIPMSLFRQLEIDAAKHNHNEEPSTRARHILMDNLMNVDVSTPEEQATIKAMVEANWAKINKNK